MEPYLLENLSRESVSFCLNNNLNSISSIFAYFLATENSGIIKKLDFDVRNQIKALCLKYFNAQIKKSVIPDISLQELRMLENLSSRTFNICDSLNLKTISAIVQYKLVNFSYREIRNCGTKTQRELDHLCDKYQNYFLNDFNYEDMPTSKGIENELKKIKNEQELISFSENTDLLTLAKEEGLSARSCNICEDAGLTSLKLIIEYFYNHQSAGFLSLRKCGQKSNKELINLCVRYENLVTSIHTRLISSWQQLSVESANEN